MFEEIAKKFEELFATDVKNELESLKLRLEAIEKRFAPFSVAPVEQIVEAPVMTNESEA